MALASAKRLQEVGYEAVKADENLIHEITNESEAYNHGMLLALKDRGIINYRARLHSVDAERMARWGDHVEAGRKDAMAATEPKAKVEKADGRAGRDGDGDGLVNERERPAAVALRPARPRPQSRLGEKPSQLLTGTAVTAAGAGVAGAAAMVARALARSPNRAVRLAGYGVGGYGALVRAATLGFAGTTAANDIAYQ